MRKPMHQLDEWLTEIEDQANQADTLERRSRLITLQREALFRFYVRIQTLEEVECYRKHMDAYAQLNRVRE